MPVFSLPGEYGIGTLGHEAYWFVQTIKQAGFSVWQLLPMNAMHHPWCPYQSYSSFAGSELYISPDILYQQGYLSENQYEWCKKLKKRTNVICYLEVFHNIHQVLSLAYENFKKNRVQLYQFEEFCDVQSFWLDDYAVFTVIFEITGWKSLEQWEEPFRRRESKVLNEFVQKHREKVEYVKFVQFVFFEQWKRLREFCREQSVLLVGDVPFYVSRHSVEVWVQPHLFTVDDDLLPYEVSGVPPDYFNADGQLWGTPVYRWQEHKPDLYQWWYRRLKHAFELYDVIRLDHFRAFADYWVVRSGATSAAHGEFRDGPGLEFFNFLREQLGQQLPIIAEDLGMLTDKAYHFIRNAGFPGMKVLQFAFDGNPENPHLPHNYHRETIVYTGTHDNNTLKGWYRTEVTSEMKKFIRHYTNTGIFDNVIDQIIRLSLSSVAMWAIIPYQDFLQLGAESRINVPGTLAGNWIWKMKNAKKFHIEKFKRWNVIYDRVW